MHLQLTTKDRERFERYVDRSGGPDACHPWTGYCNRSGHGKFWLHGRVEQAHRVAWVLAGNEITPEKPCVLHDCPDGDLPACCNERHLWGGTRMDNQRDMAKKGRGKKSKIGLPFGVYKAPGSARFYARIRNNGKLIYLGGHDTDEKASRAALRAKGEVLNC